MTKNQLFGKLTKQPLTLAMDRTNWKTRGNEVNILTLCVCLGDVGLPIIWTDLRQTGNSNSATRIELVRRFIHLFGKDELHVLVGDREFIGKEWFSRLIDEDIPFVMRLRENMYFTNKRGVKRKAVNLFRHLRQSGFCDLGKRYGQGVMVNLCAVRTSGKELLVFACRGVEGADAAEAYMRRWNTETGFEKLKSHGFHMEASRLRGDGKMELLLAVLAVAMAWRYACGIWSAKTVKPIKLKKHGRKEHSVFARGLMLLGDLFHGVCKNLRQVALVAFNILRTAVAAQE